MGGKMVCIMLDCGEMAGGESAFCINCAPLVAQFQSIGQAQNEIAVCTNELRRMTEDLRGCDWCCGGGDQQAAVLNHNIESAMAWIETNGGEVLAVKRSCEMCHYADQVKGSQFCERCAGHIGGGLDAYQV